MKIIKAGDLSFLEKPKNFKCTYCKCEFIANQGEYKYMGMQHNIPYYVCECPTCYQMVYTEE